MSARKGKEPKEQKARKKARKDKREEKQRKLEEVVKAALTSFLLLPEVRNRQWIRLAETQVR